MRNCTPYYRKKEAVLELTLSILGRGVAVHPATLVHEEGIITQWFSNHHFPLAKLREYTVKKLGGPCELVKAAATRFGTNTLVGERLKLKGALQATCTDEAYVEKKTSTSTRPTPRRSQALGVWCARTREAPRASCASTIAHLVFGRAVTATCRPHSQC